MFTTQQWSIGMAFLGHKFSTKKNTKGCHKGQNSSKAREKLFGFVLNILKKDSWHLPQLEVHHQQVLFSFHLFILCAG